MRQYLDLLKDVRTNGVLKPTRAKLLSTGENVSALSVFGRQMRFDLNEGFPLVTTKKVDFNAITHEILWFLSGSTNVKYLIDNGVNIWTAWCDGQGELGPVYGSQWRSWKSNDGLSIDQIRWLEGAINSAAHNPTLEDGRRLILSAWNVGDLHRMALPPCHYCCQFNVTEYRLSCLVNIRSNDLFLGAPYNIAGYALLTHMLAHSAGIGVGELVYSIGDAHIYENHVAQVDEQLTRECGPLPSIYLNRDVTDIDDFRFDDIELRDYFPKGSLRGEVAV